MVGYENMDILFYDTESTGLGSKDEVIQIAGILIDQKTFDFKKVFRYYTFSTVPIDPAAFKVHGIAPKAVLEYSNERNLEEYFHKELSFIRTSNNLIMMAYNDSFDKRIINQTLTNAGAPSINFGRKMYTLSATVSSGRYNVDAKDLFAKTLNGGNIRSMEEVARTHLRTPVDKLHGMLKVLCKRFGVPDYGENQFHDALFDVFIMARLVYENKALMYA